MKETSDLDFKHEKILVKTSIGFSAYKKRVIKLKSPCRITRIDCCLMARIRAFHFSKPKRGQLWGQQELISEARKSSFCRLIDYLEIRGGEDEILVARYDGYVLFYMSLSENNKIKIASLPKRNRTETIETNLIIHSGLLRGDVEHWEQNITKDIPWPHPFEITLKWTASSALGSDYDVEWARLDMTVYGYKRLNKPKNSKEIEVK